MQSHGRDRFFRGSGALVDAKRDGEDVGRASDTKKTVIERVRPGPQPEGCVEIGCSLP